MSIDNAIIAISCTCVKLRFTTRFIALYRVTSYSMLFIAGSSCMSVNSMCGP